MNCCFIMLMKIFMQWQMNRNALKDTVLPLKLPTIYVTREIIEKISTLETPGNIMALCNMLPEEQNLGNKILFGSDFPLLEQSRYFKHLDCLKPGEKNLIMGGNAERLLLQMAADKVIG